MNPSLLTGNSDKFWQIKFDNDFGDYKIILGEDYELQGNNWKDKYMNIIKEYSKFAEPIVYPIKYIDNPYSEAQLAAVQENPPSKCGCD